MPGKRRGGGPGAGAPKPPARGKRPPEKRRRETKEGAAATPDPRAAVEAKLKAAEGIVAGFEALPSDVRENAEPRDKQLYEQARRDITTYTLELERLDAAAVAASRQETTPPSREAAAGDLAEQARRIIEKPRDSWTEADKQALLALLASVESQFAQLEGILGPLKAELTQQLDGDVLDQDGERARVLSAMSNIRAAASSVPEEYRAVWFLSILKGLPLSDKLPAVRDRESETTQAVIDCIKDAQLELEHSGLTLPQEIALFNKDKKIMESLAIIGAATTKGSIGIMEGGTLATFVLMLRQELLGQHFGFLSAEHIASTLLVIALTTPLIEAAKHKYIADPIQREKVAAVTSKGTMQKLGDFARSGGISMVFAASVTAVSAGYVQPGTIAAGLAGAVETGHLGEQAAAGQNAIRLQVESLSTQGEDLIRRTAAIEREIIDTEITGGQRAGRGGTGRRGIGNVAAMKIGLLLGTWAGPYAEQNGPIPQGAMGGFARGQQLRQELGLSRSLSGEVQALHEGFMADTADERQLIAERFAELGATVEEVDFWVSNPLMVKAALTIGFTPPGQAIVDARVRAALEPVHALQERHQQFVADVDSLVDRVGDALNAEASRSGRSESPVEIEAESAEFDTSLLEGLRVSEGLSLVNPLPAYQIGAEKYFGGNDILRTAAYGMAIYAIVILLIGGSAATMSLLGRRRYRRLKGEADEEYEYAADAGKGYLIRFASALSKRLNVLFASGAGVLNNPIMREQLGRVGSEQWLDLSPEMVRVALLEVIEELSAVKETGPHGVVGGFIHTYQEGVRQMVDRGTPPEVAAMNQVARLLKDHPELAVALVRKLLPGFYELEAYVDSKKGKDALDMEDVLGLDGHLYETIVSHLERRVAIEQTKLAWCERAFVEFTETDSLASVGLPPLEGVDQVDIELGRVRDFSETGLSAGALAGSALRRATLRTLARKIRESRATIERALATAHKLRDANDRKTALLGNTGQSAVYRRISTLIDDLEKVGPHEAHADASLERLTPKGSIDAEIRAEVIASIQSEMGTISQEDDRESFEARERRVAAQFEALVSVVAKGWSWASYEKPRWYSECLTGDYKQEAIFTLVPATDESPAPSYGVRFRIVHRSTATPVVEFTYNLASTFSERMSPADVERYFMDDLAKRRPVVIANVYIDRTQRALDRQAAFETRRPQRPIELGNQNSGAAIAQHYEAFYPHEAGYAHLRRLKNRLQANKAELAHLPETLDDDVETGNLVDQRRAYTVPFASLCDDAEAFSPDRLAYTVSPETLRLLNEKATNLRNTGYRITYDHEVKKFQIVRPGFIPLTKKSGAYEVTDFLSAYDQNGGDLRRTIDTFLV